MPGQAIMRTFCDWNALPRLGFGGVFSYFLVCCPSPNGFGGLFFLDRLHFTCAGLRLSGSYCRCGYSCFGFMWSKSYASGWLGFFWL